MVLDTCSNLLVEEGSIVIVLDQCLDERRCIGDKHELSLTLELLEDIIYVDEDTIESCVLADL